MKTRMKRFLLTGLATMLPILLTIYLLYFVLLFIHNNVGGPLNAILAHVFGLRETVWMRIAGDAVAFLALLLIIWLAGFLIATYLGKALFRWLDVSYRRIPIVRMIYPAVKQVTDFFLMKDRLRASRVVGVEYPRKGVFSIGFVTGDGLSQVTTEDGERMITVFVPSSPAPMTGWTIFVRQSEVRELSLTVDEAVKMMVSGGVIVPDREKLPGRENPLLAAGSGAEEDAADEESPEEEG